MLAKISKIKISTVVSAVFLVFALFYFFVAMGLKYWGSVFAPGPGFIPRWTSGAMALLSAFTLVKSFKDESPTLDQILPQERSSKINLFVCWASLLFLLFFVNILGFVVTASIALAAMLSRGTGWLKSALIAVSFTLICFFVFRVLLKMQIPVNQFGF